jgi:hypothetical protein
MSSSASAPVPASTFAHELLEFWPVLIVMGVFLFISFLISHMGWRRFARKYPAKVRPEGRAYNVPGASFNILSSYRNLVRVVFTAEGIYFYVLFVLRFHPPFLLPWESVTGVAERKGWFGGRHYELVVEEGAGQMQLFLSQKVERDLFRYLQRPAAATG